jgi:predicted short-subunit dehydrogenase-like oxidoreductase (DUF2520 family)
VKPTVLASSVVLVGPGRAGKAFARSWLAAGGRILEVVARSPRSARQGAAEIGAGTPRPLSRTVADAEILVVAVPDDAITAVARRLAGKFRGKAAFHVSGALAAEALAPLRSSGAAIGSLHPARVFTGARGEDWKNAFVAVEGDPGAVLLGAKIAKAVGAFPRRVSAASKPAYHAAAALAAGGTAALVSLATRAWKEAGIPQREARRALAALAGQAASAVSEREFAAALTGPIARRDLGTVSAHAAALAPYPQLRSLYRILASEILARTPGLGREKQVRARLASGSPRKRKR